MPTDKKSIMYAVIAPVPADLATVIEPYRQKFDPLAKVIPPHITVLKPFRFAGSAEKLYSHLDQVGENHAPIKVSLLSWDVYEQTNYQLRLPIIAGQPELITLRNDLLTGPLSHLARPNKEHWPHITFGRFLKQSDLEKAKKALKGFEPQFTFRVTYLEILHRDRPADRNMLTYRGKMLKQIGLKATVLSPLRKKKRVRTNRQSKG